VALNVIVFAVFIVFIIVFYTISEPEVLPCFRGARNSNYIHSRVNLAYLGFLAILSILMAVAVVAVGSLFIRLILSSRARKETKAKTRTPLLRMVQP
jgi:hypothetical protein